MAEIVQGGQTFEIKGDEPTDQEQIAIDTFLKARNFDDEMTGIQDIDEGRVFITPEDVLFAAVMPITIDSTAAPLLLGTA